MKRYASIFPFVAMIVALSILLSGCKKKDEEEPLGGTNLQWIVGTFEFKSATFQEMIDLDGEGIMAPTNDALSLVYDVFNIYLECSSIFPMFEFTIEGDFYHYCKETGLKRKLGIFTFYPGTNQFIDISPDVWYDPANLFAPQTDFRFLIDEAVKTDGLWNFVGTSAIRLEVNPSVQTVFDFELQEVVIED